MGSGCSVWYFFGERGLGRELRGLALQFRLLFLEAILGLGDHCFKGRGVLDRQIGKDLAVEFDSGGLETFHETAVGQTVRTSCGVNTLHPQIAEGALAHLAVTVVIRHCLPDGVFRVPEVLGTEATETFGFRKNSLATLPAGWGIGCSGHLSV